MAETYGVLDYRAHPAQLIAVLALGLRPESRVMMALTGQTVPRETLLFAIIADNLAFLAWTKTRGAQHNSNRPKSIVKMLTSKKEISGVVAYDTPEEFEAARQEILERAMKNGN